MNLRYKKVDKNDIGFLYQLFQERLNYPKSIRFKTEDIPTYKEHEKFVKNHLKGNGYHSWHIIILNDEKVGAICIKKNGEWGYHVLRKHWKKGIGQTALKWLIEQNPETVMMANIKVGNSIAKHIAKKFGHVLVSYTYVRFPNKKRKKYDGEDLGHHEFN